VNRLAPEAVETEAGPDAGPPLSRMAIAVLALVGLLVSGYLSLYNYGLLGVIQCGIGGCMVVQSSAYAWFPPRTISDVGVPVALMGIFAYATLFGLAIAGVQPGRVASRGIAIAIFALSAVGLVFSAWLTYLEAAVIHAWCQWCVVSAIIITVIFVLSIPGFRAARRPGAT
jgi:uncharacterized membrane protein